MAVADIGTAWAALLGGDPDAAEQRAHGTLAACVANGWDGVALDALELLAAVASAQDASEHAFRLFAAADAERQCRPLARVPPRSAYWATVVPEGAAGGPHPDSLAGAIAYAQRGRGSRKRPQKGWASLSPVELEVAELAAAGLTNPQIAERLYVSLSTVKVHLRHVFEKLELGSRFELAAAARTRAAELGRVDAGRK